MWSLFLCLGLKNMQALIGSKKEQTQRFLENGMRIPVTLIDVKGITVVGQKTLERDHYQAVQLGFSMKKKGTKAELGHAKGANLEKAPKFLREVKLADDEAMPEIGSELNPSEVLTPGDIVHVVGTSKGKGFAGGVKRHGFHGGPKTHGQSDRHRAPGAIGQGTTPGRVYKGKRMAGKMGNEQVTVENLEVMDVTNDGVLVVKGLVPGVINSLLTIKKVDANKKFVPLWQEKVDEPAVEETPESTEAAPSEEPQIEEAKPDEQVEASSEEVKVEEPATEEIKEEASSEVSTEENVEAPAEEVKEEVAEGEENANS